MNRITSTIAAMALILGFNSLAYGVIIDEFDAVTDSRWPVTSTDTFPIVLTDTGSSIGAINDRRQTTIIRDSASFSGSSVDIFDLDPGNGPTVLSYSTGFNVDASVQLDYGTLSGGTPLGLDFAFGSIVRINFLDFDRANNTDLPVTVTIVDGSGFSTFVTQTLTAPGSQNVDFDFTGASGVNLNNIASVRVFFDAQLSHDFALDFIETVPEPSTWAMIGTLGLAGVVVGVRRRRKLKKQAE